MEKYSESETETLAESSTFDKKKETAVFYNLILGKAAVQKLFDSFKKHHKHDKLVFQFFYPVSPKDGSPTLGAYSMRSKNQCIKKSQKIEVQYLDYSDKSSEPLIGRAQFLGDQQLDADDLKKLIKDSNPSKPDIYEYLFFKAKFSDNNPHIYYEVSVHPSADAVLKTIPTDPSPPAPAR